MPVAPEVAGVMAPYVGAEFATPSSDHALGLRARRAIDEVRGSVAARANGALVHTDAARVAQLRDDQWTPQSAKVDGTGRHTLDEASLANTLLVSFPGAHRSLVATPLSLTNPNTSKGALR